MARARPGPRAHARRKARRPARLDRRPPRPRRVRGGRPRLPALRAQRLRPDDALVVRNTLERLAAHPSVRPGPVAVIAVSVGLGPVALALDDPALAERVRLVVALGGYADARELIRYFTTGAFAFGGAKGLVVVNPDLAGSFLARNLDLVPDSRDRAAVRDALEGRPAGPDAGPGARAVLALLRNRDPARGGCPARRPPSGDAGPPRAALACAASRGMREPGSSSSTARRTPPFRSRRACGWLPRPRIGPGSCSWSWSVTWRARRRPGIGWST